MTIRIAVGMLLLGLGLAVVLVAALGLFRMETALDRLQAGALTDTLGLLLMMGGLMVLCGLTVHSAKLLLALAVLWLTNPVSGHLIARMEMVTGLGIDPEEETGEEERLL